MPARIDHHAATSADSRRTRPGVTFASFQALGMDAGLEAARWAEELGFNSFWTAETTGAEAFATLAAAGAAATARAGNRRAGPPASDSTSGGAGGRHPAGATSGPGDQPGRRGFLSGGGGPVARGHLRRCPARPGTRLDGRGPCLDRRRQGSSREHPLLAGTDPPGCASGPQTATTCTGRAQHPDAAACRSNRRRGAPELPPGVGRAVVHPTGAHRRANRRAPTRVSADLRLRSRRRV